jgi:DNA-binding CsgD family transcriptional regulator
MPSDNLNRDRQMLHLVGGLYDAATDLDKWPVFLRATAKFFNARGAQILIIDNEDRRIGMSIVTGFEDTINDAMVKKLQELLPTDPRMDEWSRLPGKVQHERQFMSEETLHATQMYQEVLKVVEMEYHMVFLTEAEPGVECGLAIIRDPSEHQFTDQDCELLSELIPHVRRAVNIQKRIAVLDFNNRLALESLDSIPLGIFMCNEAMNIRSCNQMARGFSDHGDGLTIANDAIQFEGSMINDAVRKAVHDGVTQARAGNVMPNQAFSIPRPSGAAPYSLIVSILWGNHICIDEGLVDEPVAVLYITDPDKPIETDEELLCRLFGLTTAESSLVRRLVSGMDLKTAAEDHGVTEGTARQYLKSVFSKMECSSQKDMVARILSSSAWVVRKQ